MLLGFAFTVSCLASLVSVDFFRRVALRYRFLDIPGGRRKHRIATPYLGGAGIFVGFALSVLIFSDHSKGILGILLGSLILVIVGSIDDKYELSALHKLLWQFVAAGILIVFGVGIENITSPFGGILDLSSISIPFYLFGYHHINLFADLFTLLWVVGIINVMNFLDGVDGLAGSVSFVGCLIIFSLSLLPHISQPEIALLAICLAGSLLAFLNSNFPPARIFMGDGGSMLLGYILASLAILSSGKIATTALVLGVPILDLLMVVFYRTFILKTPFWKADRSHIHHRLLDIGIPAHIVVLIIAGICAVFGWTALFLGTWEKVLAFGILGIVVIGGLSLLERFYK